MMTDEQLDELQKTASLRASKINGEYGAVELLDAVLRVLVEIAKRQKAPQQGSNKEY